MRTSRFPRARAVWERIRDRYPELPPAPNDTVYRVSLMAVAAMVLAYVVFFTVYLWAQHDAFQTHAEDLGIMDQAIWNTLHGAPLHQTICNVVGDTNCLGDVSRLSIHFEPILFPISLLYLIAPSPKTLQALQTVVVALGAFPAFWIASRRLRSGLAGVVFAAVYLLYPTLQAAVTYDFHAVTLSAAFLMFALYFMLSRNDKGLVIACLLALSTKEQIVLDVALIGLSVALLQRRQRLGYGLVALSAVWLAVELVIMHLVSPLGHSPTAGRYAYLGDSPLQAAAYLVSHPLLILQKHVLDQYGRYYLRSLLSPVAYLPLLSPLTLLISVPSLAINLLSSDSSMRSGLYQYNADIVPVLVLAAIESVALLAVVSGRLWVKAQSDPWRARLTTAGKRLRVPAVARRQVRTTTVPAVSRIASVALTLLVLGFSLHEQQGHGYTPLTQGFVWPRQTAHTRLANDFLQRIPPDASVSAQSSLVPHLSHRRHIYLYPYMAQTADYVLLDVTSDYYPYVHQPDYARSVQQLLASQTVHVVAAQDGYLLLAHGAPTATDPANPYGLSASFYSFTQLPPGAAIPHPMAASFGPSLQLVGYGVSPSLHRYVNSYITVTTYWRATGPVPASYTPQLAFLYANGAHYLYTDFAAIEWRSMNTWPPGEVVAVQSWALYVRTGLGSTLGLGMRVIDRAANGDVPAQIERSEPSAGAAKPELLDDDDTIQFATLPVSGR